MRLLFAIKSLATAGGAEKVLSEIGPALVARGHEVVIASFDPAQANDFYQFGSVERVRLSVGRPADHTRPRDFPAQVLKLRQLVRQVRPDLSIGFMHSAFVPLALGSAGTKVPVIASEHTSIEHYQRYPGQLRLVRAVAPLCAAFTVQSDRVRDGFPAGIADRMQVVPNPVAVDPPDRADRAGAAAKRLLCVGRLRPEKGHASLIDAFALISDRFPDWTLRLVGDGPCLDDLVRQVARLRLEGRVEFAGAIKAVAGEYAAADLAVMPSTYESFGLATAEALASGIPVVGFADCPGTNELVEPGVNGLLVSGDNRSAALADGLAALMSDADLRHRLGAAGPASVARYSLDATADRWEALARSVVRNRG